MTKGTITVLPTFYQFTAKSLQEKDIRMEAYAGKTVLVVNTASKCGLTPQFEGLEQLYKKFKQQNVVILGFPCNQFANQEPGTDQQIAEGCLINYGVSFPMFSKIEVNGSNAHPLYVYLKKELPGIFGGKIRWNFTKFLIGPDGKPVKRFAPTTKPATIDAYLENFLKVQQR